VSARMEVAIDEAVRRQEALRMPGRSVVALEVHAGHFIAASIRKAGTLRTAAAQATRVAGVRSDRTNGADFGALTPRRELWAKRIADVRNLTDRTVAPDLRSLGEPHPENTVQNVG
jgi:hypothetical protein